MILISIQKVNFLKIAIIIPARFNSSRFPGKPLVKIFEKTMIEHVWEKCSKVLPSKNVYVATDSSEIERICLKKNINSILTNKNCLTGTDRVYEASLKVDADIIINVQGDEPLIDPLDILKVIKESKKNPNQVINAMCEISDEKDYFSKNIPKVVVDNQNNLLYMSRAPIPYNKKGEFVKSFKQVCVYAFPKEQLKKFYEVRKKTHIENFEDIEILRFLELGINIKMVEVSKSSVAVDTPDDLKKVKKILIEKKN